MSRLQQDNADMFREKSGSTVMAFSLVAPLLLAAVALGVDYATGAQFKARLQAAADSAALAAAKEFTVANTNASNINVVARNYAETHLGHLKETVTVGAAADLKGGTITVKISMPWTPFLSHYFDQSTALVYAEATARARSGGKLCVVALDPTGKEIVHLDDNARLVGNECGVYSNSNNAEGIRVEQGARMIAHFVCSAGGIRSHKEAEVYPTAVVDCPAVKDPLGSRSPPPVSTCQYTKLEIKDRDVILNPATYCGGIKISGRSIVRMNPGVHVIKSGLLEVTDSASLTGSYVTFFLTQDAAFKFDKLSYIHLSAQKEGPHAGILFFEDRDQKAGLVHKITSDNARTLLGTIYLPRGGLEVDSDGPVADRSAYTAIVARSLKLKMGPVLQLNSDYSATDIPVPSSFLGGDTLLVR